MRGFGSDLGVAARGLKALRGQLGPVGGVNQVMRNAGVIGKLFEQRIEDGDGFLKVACCVHVFVGKRHQRKCIEGGNFAVAWIFGIKLLESGGIGLGAIGMGQFGFRSEEHTSESSHSSISYAVFCLKKKSSSDSSVP